MSATPDLSAPERTQHLTPEELRHALQLRDLSDPSQGAHAMQQLLSDVTDALRTRWDCSVRVVRNPPLVATADNYDRLGYAPDDVTRERRYTRYVSPSVMLRSHTSAELPVTLEQYRDRTHVDELITVPGLVHRRDVVDRTHVASPHQVDLWRLRSTPATSNDNLIDMIETVVEATLPGARWRLRDVHHPYTLSGRQVDVEYEGRWLELAECGRIHPRVLSGAGLDPSRWSGLALGMGLDRALMLRKQVPDIRYLRSEDPRARAQMQDLTPWHPVSSLPATRRDLSVVIGEQEDEETLGDRVRTALGPDADLLESVCVLASTPCDRLPERARARLGICEGQINALIRLEIRPIQRTLTSAEANELRNRVYLALHDGPYRELI